MSGESVENLMGDRSRPGGGKTGSEDLARLIRDRRKQLGMTRQELAEATGVPYPTIAQIETAYRGVSPSRLGVIATTLGLDPAQLYDALTGSTRARGKLSSSSLSPTPDDPAPQWHVNPHYASFDHLTLAEPSPSPSAPPPRRHVVEHAVRLLLELPADQRLEALAHVQSRLVAEQVQEELRRRTSAQ